MALRPRGAPAPYQVMKPHPPTPPPPRTLRPPGLPAPGQTGANGGAAARGPGAPAATSHSASAAPMPSAQPSPLPAHGWSQLNTPLVFRMPRGYAALAVGGLLLIVILAYMIGVRLGEQKAANPANANPGDTASTGDQPPVRVGSSGTPGGTYASPNGNTRTTGRDSAGQSAAPGVGSPGDFRVKGRYYFTMVTTSKPYAIAYLQFLYSNPKGVDAIAVKVHNSSPANPQYVVIAPEAFKENELRSARWSAYRQKLIDLAEEYRRGKAGSRAIPPPDYKPYDGAKPDDLLTKANLP